MFLKVFISNTSNQLTMENTPCPTHETQIWSDTMTILEHTELPSSQAYVAMLIPIFKPLSARVSYSTLHFGHFTWVRHTWTLNFGLNLCKCLPLGHVAMSNTSRILSLKSTCTRSPVHNLSNFGQHLKTMVILCYLFESKNILMRLVISNATAKGEGPLACMMYPVIRIH